MIVNNHPFPVNDQGHLEIGGIDCVDLAKKYGTPLYVYDVSIIRQKAKGFVKAFQHRNIKAKVAYASKAFSSIAILQVINQEGLCLDVVSEGELYTALKAGFPVERIHFHGNNKSLRELRMAVRNNIGCIVVDNFLEIDMLHQVLTEEKKTMDVLIRVTPGVESHTHEYIQTGSEDSKFGFNIQNRQAEQAFRHGKQYDNIRIRGVHCHIGSQIFETEGFRLAVEVVFQEMAIWKERYGYVPEVVNFGGGFGIRYTEDDQPLPHKRYVDDLVEAVQKEADKLQIALPEIWIEPGRAIVGEAGITLYTIGALKEIPGIRSYIAVDGGMTDNIRPALYQAKYEGVVANKADHSPKRNVSIAGKCCESGDMLIWNLPVPEVEPGDILAVFSTGAYGYSMASNYNRLPKPAVVFVENGKDQLVVRRETYDDIVRNDLFYES
ncbi:diaminopimelate decarboxylase [Compostibacillus humi]|uniref:Diaminopimelate decarboxylase n=1 Tax=Compostibacillus humi TaxID=1245525 RepID=A0A8J2ZQ12_9BACI|nr:diaminopimelate decarboxylase [Compostibacillus humi]GGH69054.1 diaminopimelate decarboxylase [Compostibacillus humi]